AQSRSGVYLVATLPLMQGFGREATAGMETAARQDIEASRTELQHAISEVVQDTSQAYWKYVQDYMYLEQRRMAEQRAEEMLRQTRALVEADEIPAAELDESRANLSDKKTARINAEQSILESRLDLGMAMGVPFEDIRDLPPPAEDFGVVEARQKILSGLNYMSLVEHALDQRHDLKASKGREESATTRQKVLEDRMRSRLDLGMQAGYEGLDEGDSYWRMPGSAGSNVRGLSWQMSLTYEFPVENRQARGRLGQQRVEYRRQALQSRELARHIQGRVHTTFSVLRQNLMELENARGTVKLYQDAVKNQEMKFRMGMAPSWIL
ncbi:MAG: TolC family protein, partial [Desulfonatronovibrio sp.]